MNRRMNSLGVVPDTYADEPWFGEQPGIPSTTKPSVTDVLKDWFGIAKQGVEIYNEYKDGTVPGGTLPNNTPPPPAGSNVSYVRILKYGMVAAGVGLLAYGGYQALKSSKK